MVSASRSDGQHDLAGSAPRQPILTQTVDQGRVWLLCAGRVGPDGFAPPFLVWFSTSQLRAIVHQQPSPVDAYLKQHIVSQWPSKHRIPRMSELYGLHIIWPALDCQHAHPICLETRECAPLTGQDLNHLLSTMPWGILAFGFHQIRSSSLVQPDAIRAARLESSTQIVQQWVSALNRAVWAGQHERPPGRQHQEPVSIRSTINNNISTA